MRLPEEISIAVMPKDQMRKEARKRGYNLLSDFAAYRVTLKRRLQELGIEFELDEPTDSLEMKLGMVKDK